MIIKPNNPEELEELLKSKPLILYGMGSSGKRIAAWCEKRRIEYLFSDKRINEMDRDSNIKTILPQDIVLKYPEANIVISSLIYAEEITNDLLQFGVKKEQLIQPFRFMPDKVVWKDIENDGYSDWEHMRRRFQMIVQEGWLPDKLKSVADYGAGHKFMKELISIETTYYPIDFIDRGENTIICDFNKREFPEVYSELSVCVGVLMYIKPAEELICHICEHTERWIIFSFITLEGIPDIEVRKKFGMCQHYTEQEIIDIYSKYFYILRDKKYDTAGAITTLLLFEKQ